ncbi:hypothetical protein [Campylobacter sp. 19-13652]|uniref:hypothetical protein n=1 Tax=Campylobacter sp. 19-13652 TaxID=2840180 RepID=UPI001C7718BC|nr:hypothetical protein [Campylobacter sp. 19-13652]BCX79969.1 hypothetical protein LBC_14310 [Campylobacter sp. 19-13652]
MIHSGDTIDAKEGYDTLKIYTDAAFTAGTTPLPQLTSVEKLDIQTTEAVTYNNDIKGVVELYTNSNGANKNVAVGANLKELTKLTVDNFGGTVGVNFTNSSLKDVTLSKVGASVVTVTAAADQDVAVNLKDVVNTADFNFATGTKLALNLGGESDSLKLASATLKELTLSGNAASANIELKAATNALTKFTNNYNGDLTLTLAANAGLSDVKLGSGNDKVIVGAYAGKVDGGAGDNMVVIKAASDAITMDTAKYTNFNQLGLDMTGAGGAVTADAAGLAKVELTTDLAQALTINNVAAGSTLVLKDTDAVTSVTAVIQKDSEEANANDVLNVNVVSGTVAALTAAKFETVNITTGEQAATLTAATFADATTINVSGDQNLTLADGLTAVKLTTLNASNLTGVLSVDVSGLTTVKTVNGGAGNDAITFSVDSNVDLTGGAGDDRFIQKAAAAAGSTDQFVTIKDFAKGDSLVVKGKGTATKVDAKIELAHSMNPDETSKAFTFLDYVNKAVAGDGNTNSITSWFQYNGDTYVVTDVTAGATFDVTDSIIKLAGLHDLSLSASGTDVTVTIA